MRAGDLFGAPVVDPQGRRRGVVVEIRTRAEEEPGRRPVLVVEGFIVGRHRWRLLGYERSDEQRPALLRAIVRWLHRHTRYAPWDDVDVEPPGVLRLHTRWEDLRTLFGEPPRR